MATQQQPLDDDDDDWGVFETDDEAAELAALARAEEDIAAGRVISHEAMVAWLSTWGTENRLPRPKCGE